MTCILGIMPPGISALFLLRQEDDTKAFLPAVPSAVFFHLLFWLPIDLNREKAGWEREECDPGNKRQTKAERGRGRGRAAWWAGRVEREQERK